MDQRPYASDPEPERAVLVGVVKRDDKAWETQDSLDELAQLARTAGAVVSGSAVFKQPDIHPGHLIGTGKAEQVASLAREQRATLVLFDEDLSPAQGRNLETICGVRVMDRTQLILDIFAKHAHSRDGSLQIELAQLEYLMPRLRRMWTHLERQKGGIGLRGPGEQQLELDRRRIEERITRIKRDLEKVRKHRAELRRGRQRHGWSLVSLVGYTNAGKSTLLNALTGSSVKAEDQLFATLDPTTRQIALPNTQPALLTDTVGFIRKLPHHLVESFKATLEEVLHADLLVHVIDASHPRVDDQVAAVATVLGELGAAGKPMICALNKMDVEGAASTARRLAGLLDQSVCISARTGEGLDEFRQLLADAVKEAQVEVELNIPLRNGAAIARLREVAAIREEHFDDGETARIVAGIPRRHLAAFSPYMAKCGFEEDVEEWERTS